MGQTASQIENHIEDQRNRLSSNLHELEDKVKSVTDWRIQFKNRPMTFIGIAFGGGVMAAAMSRSSRGYRGHRSQMDSMNRGPEGFRDAAASRTPSPTVEKAHRAIDALKGALVGVAVSRAKDYADQIIPGFAKHFQETETEQKHEAVRA